MQRSALRHPSSLLAPVFTGCIYFAAASLALMTSRFEGGLAFIWGANALLMAELLTARSGYWPRVVLSCAMASALATTIFGMGALAALPMAIINMLESMIVALLCRRFVPGRRVAGSMRPLAVFLLALCMVANVVAATMAAAVAAILTPVGFLPSWGQWYSGHVLGGLICTPILLMLYQGELGRWLRETRPSAKLEALGLLAFFALSIWWIFYQAHYPLLFASLLPLVLIAFRTGYLGSAAAIVILALIGGTATLTGHGPLNIIPGTLPDRVQFFQFYLALSFLLAIPVAAELNGRRRLTQMLRDSEARYRAIAEHSGDGVLNLSVDGIIQYASPAAIDQIGHAPDRLIGHAATELIDPDYCAIVVATHRRALAQPDEAHAVEFRPRHAVRDDAWYEMLTRAVLDHQGLPIGVISTVRDITKHKARQKALQQAAAIDMLTGADSRRATLEKLEIEMARVATGGHAALLLIDIDHFKAVNDRYGHGAGDRVLIDFVDRMRTSLRGMGSIGRLGGEEFAILLPDADIDRASRICEHLRRRLAAHPFVLEHGGTIAVTFSAGLVGLNAMMSAATLMDAADKALYRAKHSGRNCLRLAA
ncbi:diguanylate cyclase [Sphingobium sp. AP49]|uniref:sensor domain-containing diguanylate cyclase n=1 Tax=Sphingobium sp. AP49 TaxID=1144307 RepID=UPI00026EE103|nr:sensor domain-containing diguanylate cyclase [Sphingobium sp. AP49]WHO39760.1 diguanylate cyclase [Sphingobium sp. AP49]